MEVEGFLMNDWERLWEEDRRCDSWRNLKLANFATITTVCLWVIYTVGVSAVPMFLEGLGLGPWSVCQVTVHNTVYITLCEKSWEQLNKDE